MSKERRLEKLETSLPPLPPPLEEPLRLKLIDALLADGASHKTFYDLLEQHDFDRDDPRFTLSTISEFKEHSASKKWSTRFWNNCFCVAAELEASRRLLRFASKRREGLITHDGDFKQRQQFQQMVTDYTEREQAARERLKQLEPGWTEPA